ncbi:uncharacterized protein [Panulirus ornatus]|uniref:uncharacterized protein isoform X1 n=1 Tax=Panulirus ornatus TaxID=150431 RepID=UPI003A87738E
MEKDLDKKKSILKIGVEKKGSKRLTFASAHHQTMDSPIVGTRRSINEIVSTNMKDKLKDLEVTPQKKKEEQKLIGSIVSENQSDFLDITSTATPTSECIKRTPMGLCYVPEKISGQSKTHYQETAHMKNNKRNNFGAVLKSISTTGPTANVLIIGDKIRSEKLKTNLLNVQSLQLTPRSLGCNIILNIICEESLSPNTVPDVSFFIFLISLDKLESLVQLSNIFMKINNVGIPSTRKLVLSVSSAQGFHKNVIGQEEYEIFLDCHQLVCLPWEEQGRPDDQQMIKLLILIYSSVGYYRGSSLLMKYVMQQGIKEYPEDNTMFY